MSTSALLDKRGLSERDICTKFITPAVASAGWDLLTQVREELDFTKGRIHEDTKKFYFTLVDFKGAASHFADPDFDGEPVQIYEPSEGDPVTPPDDAPPVDEEGAQLPPEPGPNKTILAGDPSEPGDATFPPDRTRRTRRTKIYVDGVPAAIVAERIEYLDEHGKLVW